MERQQAEITAATGNTAGPSASNPAAGSVLTELPARDTTALVRTVRERLRLAITQREIPEGTRLNQVQVANQLGVSRMPVRAAVSDLVAEGILEPIASGGVAVRTLTERDVRDVYEVRMALESQAVRHVAERRPSQALARIEQVLTGHGPHVADYDAAQLIAADREFHNALLDATENEYFRRAILPLWSIVERAIFDMVRIPGMVARAWSEHEQIAKAVLAGNPERAERALRLHLGNAAEQLAELIRESNGGTTADR